ncbi:M16 family metallopeptidase [Sphingobacterium sp. Mn56C]|uniref:M16 family metallopeptidase n=1 Tax=Sphingobacterium sp. Mn56C TaxID=3395261 RepID=UPI003BD10C12
MLDRTIAPAFRAIKALEFVQPESITYGNGLQAFVFKDSNLELVKFEFVFQNIFENGKSPLQNSMLSAMLKEGTSNLSSAQIAEKVDYYGAFLMPEYSFDHTSLTVYTMHKYAASVLPIVRDILQYASIPQEELDTHTRNNKQNLQISLKKNDVLARRMFYTFVFGDNQYGTVPELTDFDAIQREDILQLYHKQINPKNCTLFISGKVDSALLEVVAQNFATGWEGSTAVSSVNPIQLNDQAGTFKLTRKEDALQSAIRMGGLSINRTHPDYPAVQFVNTLLGGFFGSRLMRNIREEKGYTYSIGSAVANLKHTGFFTLASEVGVDVTQATLDEIEKEFNILRTEKAHTEEVNLVRNYMQGSLLGSLESIFSHADKFKAVYLADMDLSYYQHYSTIIDQMDADRVYAIANQYFDYDKLVKVVVGKLG